MLKRLILVSVLAIVLFAWSFPIIADGSRADEQKNATPVGAALVPPGASVTLDRPPSDMKPIHNPAGSEMLIAWLTIPVTCDGNIDATEWSDAYMYDVSDTTGQQDGIPDPLGTVFLWLKQDENGIYFAIRNNADATLNDLDQCGLYFDDDYDGCFPASATNEGNNWLIYMATGGYVQWRWLQDLDCGFPPNYVCQYDAEGGYYNWSPTCFGIGIGPTGVVDYEVMIPYGVIDEYLDLTMPPDTLGFYMYCFDYGSYAFNGEWPSQYYYSTFAEPCYYGRLICEGEEQEWPNHKMHFPQLPDLEGWDVHAVSPKVLADDWQCSETGEITDIHFWGSWKDVDGDPYTDDFTTPMPWFGLSIHRNIPASADTPYSRPGEQIWWWDGEIQGVPSEPPSMEHWFNPNTGEVLYNDHVPYWRYDFFFDQALPPPDPFFQYKDSIYWLNITVHPDVCPPPYAWGWKSSRDHFMDDAVYTDSPPDGPWYEMYEPPRANWFDVYFDYDGRPEDMGSTNYYGQGWYRYPVYNWWNMWFYDNPYAPNDKNFHLNFYIEEAGVAPYVEFALNFSTPEWDEMEMGRPPLPEDGNEGLYIWRWEWLVDFGWNDIQDYIDWNPEWISIDFRAREVIINGWIWHECEGTSMDMAFVITGEEVPTGPNHYKTWYFDLQPVMLTVFVQDQFMEDSLELVQSEFLSNPVKKVVENDTFDIIRPDDHLTWYLTSGRATLIEVEYVNQFESTTVVLDGVHYLLVPTQKEGHAPPEGLDHYLAYHIQDPVQFPVQFWLEDQFDVLYGEPEFIEYLVPRYFLTPAIKNMEQPQLFDSLTHYVAYEISPTRYFPLTVDTWDQFSEWILQVWQSYMLLVPTTKLKVCQPPNIGCPSDETQNQNGVYTTTTQWTANDGNPGDLSVELISVAVQPPLPPGISAANVNFLGPAPGPGLGVKATWGTVTYTVADHCQSGGSITLITTNSCPPPNNSATCSFNVTLTNDPPDITQPDSLEGFVNSVVQYYITGDDPNGDVINDVASIQIVPECGSYSIVRTSGSGTSSGTWQITWNTFGCTACQTYLVIHDLTDACGDVAYCTTKVHLSEEPGWVWKDDYEDYAPSGMVDIDQRQDAWQKQETQQFSFCGPCAVANCFKWFDSKYNVPPGVPGDMADQFPLVRQYIDALGGMISPYDDHDPWNVDHAATPWQFGATAPPPPTLPQPFVPGAQPGGMPPWGELVERLAWYFNTDGIQSGYCEFTGTNIMDMQAGIDAWLRSETFQDGSSLFDTLCEVTTPMPTFAYVESLVEKCEDVILLLGFWYSDAPQEFIRGDIDADGFITVYDLQVLMEGPPFLCDDAADVNDDGALDDLDSTYLWDFVLYGGDYPPAPYPDCGLDPTPDALGCADFPACPTGGEQWYRIGGHYVTVAGVNSEQSMIAFSDPFVDAAEMGMAPGRIRDGSIIPHPHGYHDPTLHNDEGNVSHDIYVAVPSPSPGGLWGLPEYPIMVDPYGWSWNFYNQNVPEEFIPVTAPWNEASAIFTEVEYCVHISPWDYRGDVNVPYGDGTIDAADIVFLINYLFLGTSAPIPFYKGDCNCDGNIDVADVVALINYVFTGTSAPRCCDP